LKTKRPGYLTSFRWAEEGEGRGRWGLKTKIKKEQFINVVATS